MGDTKSDVAMLKDPAEGPIDAQYYCDNLESAEVDAELMSAETSERWRRNLCHPCHPPLQLQRLMWQGHHPSD